ncbi:MAG: protein kinase [Alphaproteobacteria bacterium]|nr:protein kinase [Alphaproteobacteria bacterium]
MAVDHAHALPGGYQLFEYKITRVLGHGGFGITYLAWDTNLEKNVAIKEYLPVEFAIRMGDVSVKPRSSADEEDYKWGLERFLKEAQTLAVFRHPSIVAVYRFFEEHGTAYMVMEYEDGEAFSSVMKRKRGKFTEAELIDLLMPLLDGLAAVHKSGYLHRDIKPGNIYIRENGSPVLLDFGAARHAIGKKSQSLTSIVTPGYAPMEQYFADGNQGPWTDIYAMAGILYQAISGSVPAEAPARIKNDPHEPISQTSPKGFSETFLAAVDCALLVDEELRPQNVSDWRAMFAGELDAGTVKTSVAPPPSKPQAGQTMMAGRPASHAGPAPRGPSSTRDTGQAPAGKRKTSPLVWIGAGALGLVVVAAGVVGAVRPDLLGFGPTASGGTTAGGTGSGSSAGGTQIGGDTGSGGDTRAGADGGGDTIGSAEERRRLEEERKAQRDREAKAQRDREAKAQRDREAKAQRDREAKAQRDREAKAQRDREAKSQRDREAKAQRDRESRDREAQARRDRERRDREAQVRKDRARKAELERQRKAKLDRQRQQALASRVRCPSSLPALQRLYGRTDCGRVAFIFQRTLSDARGPGVTSRWRNGSNGHSGTFTILGIFRGQNGEFCRRFRQTVTVRGRTASGNGTACLYGRSWRIVRYN